MMILVVDKLVPLCSGAKKGVSFSETDARVTLAPNARAVIVDSPENANGAQIREIHLATGARLHHVKIVVSDGHGLRLRVHQDKDSEFCSHLLSFAGHALEHTIDVDLSAPGSRCTLNGLYLASEDDRVNCRIQVNHTAPHGTSATAYKGILSGKARATFDAKVVVHPDAQQSDAKQTNKNILLSDTAEVHTRPQLEIYADDVKVSHGATVGELDPDQLFYLAARGIGKAEARHLLTAAFAYDLLDSLPSESLKVQANAWLAEALFRIERQAL